MGHGDDGGAEHGLAFRAVFRCAHLIDLLLQAKEAGRADFSIPFDRQGLADYLEVDRSGLSAEMSKLKKEGVLDYFRSDFRLLQLPDANHGE